MSNIKQIIEPSGHTGYNGYFHTNRFSRKLLNTYDKAKAVTLLMQQECFVLLLLRIWAKMKTFLIHPSLGHWPTGKIIDLKSWLHVPWSQHQILHFKSPGTDPIKILQRKFYAMQFFKHSDWLLKFLNQSGCLKSSVA